MALDWQGEIVKKIMFIILLYSIVMFSSVSFAAMTNVSVSAPQYNNHTKNSQESFTFTATSDSNATATCDLWINSTLYNTNRTVSVSSASVTSLQINASLTSSTRYAGYVDCYDGATNLSSDVKYFTFDDVTPNISISFPKSQNFTNNSQTSFTFTVFDNLDPDGLFKCDLLINTTNYGSNASVLNLSTTNSIKINASLVDGSYSGRVICFDDAGNQGSSDEKYFTIDTTTPVLTILQPSSAKYWNYSDLPYYINGTVTGTNLVAVWAVNNSYNHSLGAGNDDYTPATWNFVNTTTFYDGNHTIHIRANNSAGNVANAYVTISLRTTLPICIITQPYDYEVWNYSDMPFRINGSCFPGDLVSIHANGSYAGVNDYTPATFNFANTSGVADGSHTVTVTANDSWGNVGSDTVTYTLDTIRPVINIDAPINDTVYGGPVYRGGLTINGTCTDLNLSTVRSNSTDFPLMWFLTSPFNITNQSSLENRGYTVRLSCNDSAGNFVENPVKFVWDSAPPLLTIEQPANYKYWNYSDFPFRINGTATDAHYQVLVTNDSAWTVYDTTNGSFNIANTSDITEGNHTILITVNDTLGTITQAAVTISFDFTPPTLTILQPSNNKYWNASDSPYLINGTTNGAYAVWSTDASYLQNDDYTPNVWNFANTSNLADGNHSVIIVANDSFGNAVQATLSLMSLDTEPPTLTISQPATNKYWNYSDFPFRINGTTANAYAVWASTSPYLHTVDLTPANWNFANTSDLAQGNHTIVIRANDSWGNTADVSSIFSFDSTPPNLSIEYPFDNQHFRDRVSVNGSVVETNTWWVRTNLTQFPLINSTSPFNFTNQSAFLSQNYTVAVTVNDSYGNDVVEYKTFVFDDTVPLIDYVSPTLANNSENHENQLLKVNVSITDPNIHTCILNFDNDTNYTMINMKYFCYQEVSGVSTGRHVFFVWANDSLSNSNSSSRYYIEFFQPVVAGGGAPQVSIQNTRFDISPINTTKVYVTKNSMIPSTVSILNLESYPIEVGFSTNCYDMDESCDWFVFPNNKTSGSIVISANSEYVLSMQINVPSDAIIKEYYTDLVFTSNTETEKLSVIVEVRDTYKEIVMLNNMWSMLNDQFLGKTIFKLKNPLCFSLAKQMAVLNNETVPACSSDSNAITFSTLKVAYVVYPVLVLISILMIVKIVKKTRNPEEKTTINL